MLRDGSVMSSSTATISTTSRLYSGITANMHSDSSSNNSRSNSRSRLLIQEDTSVGTPSRRTGV